MKVLGLKFKIIIGVILFVLLICSGYSANIHYSSKTYKTETEIGEKVYKGIFIIPVENFITVTSKYGARIHPITRKSKCTYWN